MFLPTPNRTTALGALKLLSFRIKSYPFFNHNVLQAKLSWPEKVYLLTDIPFPLFYPAWLQKRYIIIFIHIKKERGASSCCSFHGVRPSHCPSSPKRATQISPTRGIYTTTHIDIRAYLKLSNLNDVCNSYTFMRRSRCFAFDLMIRGCEVLHRQNQSVQKTPSSICL